MTTQELETISKRTQLAVPIELEEGPDPIFSRMLVFTICGLIFALLVWANFAKVRELSVAAGEIVPSAPLYELAHIEGGIVETVYVEEGQSVKAGDPLLKLRPETARGELQQLIAQKVALEVSAERLDAVIENREPDFAKFDNRAPKRYRKLGLDHVFLSMSTVPGPPDQHGRIKQSYWFRCASGGHKFRPNFRSLRTHSSGGECLLQVQSGRCLFHVFETGLPLGR